MFGGRTVQEEGKWQRTNDTYALTMTSNSVVSDY